MKKFYFIFYIFFISTALAAQTQQVTSIKENVFLTDAEGRPLIMKSAYNVEGTTMFPPANCIAAVKIKNGKVYQGIPGRINLQTNEFIYFLDGQEYICVLPVEEIIFNNCEDEINIAVFKTGFPSIDKQNELSFYRVLAEGRASLLKYYTVESRDDKPFNSATITRIYSRRETSYLFLKEKMFKLEKSRANMISLLASGEVRSYIIKEKLNLRKDEDAIKLLKFYNSL